MARIHLPTGTWRGWWEQIFYGRQEMKDFFLTFHPNGLIDGSGVDIVGRFTFSGEYSRDGMIRLVKQYIGKHQVLYEGTYNGEGTISGVWSLGPWGNGAFAISPVFAKPTGDEPIFEIR